ncbi:MAG: TolC family outer membrane protein [Gammaproteobacteria bacterium]|nr:TolC family outer membrane protein [Gammaproteobacteria bacterium]
MKSISSKALLLTAAFTLATSFSLSVHAITLRDTVQETVMSNPDVQVSMKVKRASNEQVNQARAGYLPTLNVNAAYGRERSENQQNRVNGPNIKTNLWRRELGVELRQNLFRGFDTWYEMKRTKAKTDADSYLVCAAAEDQALLATQAYINVLRDRELVQVARRNLRAHEGYHSMISQRGRSGVGREADNHEVSGRLALARSNLFAVENDLANSEAFFFRVTGMHPAQLSLPTTPGRPLIPSSLDEAATIALRYHPKMRSAVVDVEEARAQHNVSHRTAFPVVDIVAAAENNRDVDGVEGPDKSFRVMGEFHYNLFNGGADVARQRETAYLTQEAADIRNRTCRQVIENLRLSWNAMLTSEDRLPSLREHSLASKRSLGSYNEQFKLGKRELLDVLDTENENFAADSNFIRGCYDALYSRYRVLDAMGQLVNYLHVNLPTEAHELYHTYQEIASPARSGRQYDAGLEQQDFPSKYYHKQEPIHRNQPCNTLSCAGVITRRFTGKRLDGAFGYKDGLHSVVMHEEKKKNQKEPKKLKAKAHRKHHDAHVKENALQSVAPEKEIQNLPVNESKEAEKSTAAPVEPTSNVVVSPSAEKKEVKANENNVPESTTVTSQPEPTVQTEAEKPVAKEEQPKRAEAAADKHAKAKKSWAVKVGTYTSDKEVEKSIEKLQDKGFDGFVKEIKTPDNTTTEVYVGPTKQKSSAENLYHKLMQSNISGSVVPVEDSE